MAAAMVLAATLAAGPAAATGGLFALCYERLKQMAALYEAQGSRNVAITEPVDAPAERRYVLELRIADRTHKFTCTRDGRIERIEDK